MASWKYPSINKGSLRAMAYEIKDTISGGLPSDDNQYPIRLIEATIKHELGLAQKQEDVANELLGIAPNASRVIPFPCLPLTDATDMKCDCTKGESRFKKATLPALLQWRDSVFIQTVGNEDLTVTFQPVRGVQDINARMSFAEKPMYFVSGKSIYVSLPAPKYNLMCEITVMAIPDDPMETNGKCFDVWATDWNVPEYMKAVVRRQVLQTLAPALVQSAQSRDMRNNANDGNQFVTTQTP